MSKDDSTVRLITGDECGLIKETTASTHQEDKNVPVETKSANITLVDSPDFEQTRRNAIHALTPLNNNDNEDVDDNIFRFASLRMGGVVELYESSDLTAKSAGSFHRTSVLRHVFSAEEKVSTCDPTTSIATGQLLQYHQQPKPLDLKALPHDMLVACDTAGNVSIIKPNKDDTNNYQVQNRINVLESKHKNKNDANETKSTAMLSAFTAQNSLNSLTFGGRDRETFIYDVETQAVKWKAKNLPPDPQTLLQWPVWTTALQYLSMNDNTNNSDGNNVLAVGTAHTDRPLKIYDVRAQRKPVAYAKEGIMEHRVTALCDLSLTNTNQQLCVGDAAGYIHCLDVRQMSRQYARFVGPGGSVRSIVRYEHGSSSSLPMIACVSLDRVLRTYDINSRRMVHQVYLKQRLNCCMFAPVRFPVRRRSRAMSEEEELRVGNWGKGEDYVQAYVDFSSEDDEDEIARKGGDDDNDSSQEEEMEVDDGASSSSEELSVASSLGSSSSSSSDDDDDDGGEDTSSKEEDIPDKRHKRQRS